jgi:hypothetical protein
VAGRVADPDFLEGRAHFAWGLFQVRRADKPYPISGPAR